MIECKDPITKIIITNGFHYSREVIFHQKAGTYFFEIESCIDDVQLLTGFILSGLFYTIFVVSGMQFFILIANAPFLFLFYIFYIKKKDFIQIHRLKPHQQVPFHKAENAKS